MCVWQRHTDKYKDAAPESSVWGTWSTLQTSLKKPLEGNIPALLTGCSMGDRKLYLLHINTCCRAYFNKNLGALLNGKYSPRVTTCIISFYKLIFSSSSSFVLRFGSSTSCPMFISVFMGRLLASDQKIILSSITSIPSPSSRLILVLLFIINSQDVTLLYLFPMATQMWKLRFVPDMCRATRYLNCAFLW